MRTGKTVLVYMDMRENGVTKNGIFIYGYTQRIGPILSLNPNKGGPHYGSNFTCWCCCY